MQLLLLLSAVVLVAGGQAASAPRVVCYYATWAYGYTGMGQFLPSDLDPALCTHYIYTFVYADATGGLFLTDEGFDIGQNGIADFVAMKEQNSDLKLLVSVGGWNAGSANFSIVAANETLRTMFACNAVSFLEEYGFDGLDLDWEYPAQRDGSSSADKNNFVLLAQALKEAFTTEGYLLSAAVSATQSNIDLSYNVTALDELLDFVNVMTYDLHLTSDGVTGADAPLYPQPSDPADTALTVNASINVWIANGGTPSKMNVGIGLYGHAYTLANASDASTGAPILADNIYASPYAGDTSTWSYIEICSDIRNNTADWVVVNYNNSFVYGVKDTLWIGYDDVSTLYVKGAFAKALELGGLMFWTPVGDDFRGYCGEKYALTKAAIAGYTQNSTTETFY